MKPPSFPQWYKAAIDHEWELTDDRRHVLCATCGAKRLESTKNPRHNKGCEYLELLRYLSDD